jgi:hypothetical protein
MRTYIGLIALAGWGALAAAACSSSSPGFTGSLNPGIETTDGGDDGSTLQSGSSGGGTSSGFNTGSGGGTGMGTGTCKTGIYDGTFSCFFFMNSDAGPGMAPDSGGFGPVVGTMSFMLTQDVTTTGELSSTDTASGTFMAATGGFISADANLTGTLECDTGKFNGNLLNGVYGFSLTGGAPAPDPNNKFQGPLYSDYNGKTSAFVDGQWSMAIKGLGACIGTWMASYSGPLEAGAGDAASTTTSPIDAGGQ